MRSAKVDGVRVAVASFLGGTIPPLVESATALLRDVARAGGQRSYSRLCGSPALPHESGVMPLRLRLGAASRAAKVFAHLLSDE